MKVEAWRARTRWIAPHDILDRIAATQAKLASAGVRERAGLAKTLAFCCASAAVSGAEFSADDLARILAAGVAARRHGGGGGLLERSLLHINRWRLEKQGFGEPSTIAESAGRVTWTGGCLAVAADAGRTRTAMARPESDIVAEMNAGAFYVAGLGGDGSASLTLRLVDYPEPMLEARAFARCKAVSDTGWIAVEGGDLMAGAAEDVEQGVRLKVGAGRYLVRLFDSGAASRLVAVICRSDAPIDALAAIPTLA